MVANNFSDILDKVLVSEGGYGYDPVDPGGPTKYGITIYDVRSYVKKNATSLDVKNLTLAQAKEIYKSKYWDKVNGDALPSGVDYTVFDYGVNSGVSRANRVYSRLKTDSPISTINAVNDERMAFLHSLRTWPHFGRGWKSRVDSVRQYSLQLAKERPWTTTPTPSLPPQPKLSWRMYLLLWIYKILRISWQKISSIISFKGKQQTPSSQPPK